MDICEWMAAILRVLDRWMVGGRRDCLYVLNLILEIFYIPNHSTGEKLWQTTKYNMDCVGRLWRRRRPRRRLYMVECYCCVLKLSVDPQVDLPAWWPAYLHTRIFANLIWNLVWMLFFPAGRSSYLKSRIFISFLFIISRFLILWNLSFSLGLWSLDVCILRNSRIQQEEQNNNNYTGLREMQAMYKSPSFAIHLSRQQLINTFSLATAKKSKSHLQMIR